MKLTCIASRRDRRADSMSALVFPKYNQFDSFVRPLVTHYRSAASRCSSDTRAYDLEMTVEGEARTVTGIRARVNGVDTNIPVGPNDLRLSAHRIDDRVARPTATWTTMPPFLNAASTIREGAIDAMKNLRKKSPVFGKPDKFCGNVDKSMWGIGHPHLQAIPLRRQS